MNKSRLILVKIGGEVAESESTSLSLLSDLHELISRGYRVVLCHGAGPQITRELKKRSVTSEFIDGQRVTDAETLEVTCQILLGEINRKLVALCNENSDLAVGLSGIDSGIYRVTQRDKNLGFVGKIKTINTALLENILDRGLIPIVACLGLDERGQVYNINADSAAGELAKALKADSYLIFTNVEGLYGAYPDKNTLLQEVNLEKLKQMRQGASLKEGMIPKVESIIIALEGGVKDAVIVDGRKEHAVLNTIEGKINGTIIRQ